MIDIDFSAKPLGLLPGPPAAPYIDTDTVFTCSEALEIKVSGFIEKDGLRLPMSDLRIELPNAAVIVILELAVEGVVQIEAFDINGAVLGPPTVTVPAVDIRDYNVVDSQGRIKSLRLFGSNNESSLVRLRTVPSSSDGDKRGR